MTKRHYSLGYFADSKSMIVCSYQKSREPQTWKAMYDLYQDLQHPDNGKPIRQMTFGEVFRHFDVLQRANRGTFYMQCTNGLGVTGNTLVLNVPQNKLGLRTGSYVIDKPTPTIAAQLERQEQEFLARLAERIERMKKTTRRSLELCTYEGMKIRFAPTKGELTLFNETYQNAIYDAVTDGFKNMERIFPDFEGWLTPDEKRYTLKLNMPWVTREIMPPVMAYYNKLYISTRDACGFFSYGLQKIKVR